MDARNCECCRVQLIEGEASETPGLCSKCDEAWRAFPKLAPSYRLHVLAGALSHSGKDIARRIGCGPRAHASALGNARTATGMKRDLLIRVGAWALRTGKLDKPAGFEDCTPIGEHPEPVKAHTHTTSGSVVVSGPGPMTVDATRKHAATAEKAAARKHGNFKPGTPPEKYPEAELDAPHIGDRAEDYPEDAPCNQQYVQAEKLRSSGNSVTLQWHVGEQSHDPGLEALKRLANGQGDLIIAAFELGYARGELARVS